jgi:hypothetical protein
MHRTVHSIMSRPEGCHHQSVYGGHGRSAYRVHRRLCMQLMLDTELDRHKVTTQT